ncbi:thermonuclease family protein [Flavihumibacter cheonanensis]|uniref:thermonuclease family protein n=1 Tax=Flavihumibacter cheonanensis TaxID=1442385 RepID=UPI001EF94451|nr:thermonuclease family protein [Flavihumibacter cheonanensis]MCG7752802.1 thermonuclease family protein [Flavihumibacter cheonanensis]
MQFAYLLVTILSCFLTSPVKEEKYPSNLSGKVIGVTDGDTIDILYDNKPLRIRLAHIDCPEIRKQQPFGAQAKKFTSDNCFGQIVRVLHKNELDRNKRLIGEVINAQGLNINKELVKSGLAWHFIKYSSSQEYAALEKRARAIKVGLWKDPHPTPPWNWRKPQ